MKTAGSPKRREPEERGTEEQGTEEQGTTALKPEEPGLSGGRVKAEATGLNHSPLKGPA